MSRQPPAPTLCPYTTLFRSLGHREPLVELLREVGAGRGLGPDRQHRARPPVRRLVAEPQEDLEDLLLVAARDRDRRSEEHTSELQSHVNLVCRLLLEKKNTI